GMHTVSHSQASRKRLSHWPASLDLEGKAQSRHSCRFGRVGVRVGWPCQSVGSIERCTQSQVDAGQRWLIGYAVPPSEPLRRWRNPEDKRLHCCCHVNCRLQWWPGSTVVLVAHAIARWSASFNVLQDKASNPQVFLFTSAPP